MNHLKLKKRRIFLWASLATVPLLFFSCVSTDQDIMYLNDQLVALNARVDKLEESVGLTLSNEVDSKLESVRENQAELRAELNRVRGDLQGLSGRTEENSRLIKHSIERDTTERDMIKATLADSTQRMSQLEGSVEQIQKRLGVESASIRERTDTAPVVERQPKVITPPPIPEKKPPSTEKDIYDDTLKIYKQGDYEGSISGFKRFVLTYPNSDLADNAQFWIGECYMGLEQYEQAILAYQTVIKKYPSGNKVPNAMLRQALAFHEIKDDISSRVLLKKVIKQYPDSSEAKIAAERLKALK